MKHVLLAIFAMSLFAASSSQAAQSSDVRAQVDEAVKTCLGEATNWGARAIDVVNNYWVDGYTRQMSIVQNGCVNPRLKAAGLPTVKVKVSRENDRRFSSMMVMDYVTEITKKVQAKQGI